MADVEPIKSIRYEPSVAGPLEDVIAPPYDVIDEELRAELVARSPRNVVEIDLPEPPPGGGDRYEHAAATMRDWLKEGVLVTEEEPAPGRFAKKYTGPDGSARTRDGLFARVRVEDYGPGRIRPHERTHPGPGEDAALLRAGPRARTCPPSSASSPTRVAPPRGALERAMAGEPFASATDHEGTLNTLWRVSGLEEISSFHDALAGAELLIADGHHRYETARCMPTRSAATATTATC